MIGPTLDVPAYTEQAQLGYQGYFVYVADYVAGLGVKVTRCAAGTEVPYGVIVRGGEYAGTGDPQSVVIRRQGRCPVIAGTGDLEVSDLVGPEDGGQGVAKTTDADYYMGVCVEPAVDGKPAVVDLFGPASLSNP